VRFTIERIRTLVLVAGALLLVTLGVFLVRAKWKNLLNRHDLPHRLAKDIVQEADGYTYVHAFGAHSQYRIHASREVELKNDFIELHDVQIDLYGEDGNEIDRISGDTFEYDQKTGKATAQGPVEMLLTRPSAGTAAAMETAGKSIPGKAGGHVIAAVGAATGSAGQIDVKTSGVTFDRNSGLVTTEQRVDFSTVQGSGSAMGANYDSQSGSLTLEQAVELTAHRGADEVELHAQRAEFDRGAQTCLLEKAQAAYHGGQANAAEAKILFRADGSAERLDTTGGFTLTTANGGNVAAPIAWMDFDEHNEPRQGHMEGGVTMDSATDSANGGRTMHGTAPTAELAFGTKGELKSAHLERGVEMKSLETSDAGASQDAGMDAGKGSLRVSRTWRSPVVDIAFRLAGAKGKGQLEVETMRGSGGVTIVSESQRGNAAATPQEMSADVVTGIFGAGSMLRALSGVGHAGIEQTTAAGTRQTANGDRLEAQFEETRDQGSATPTSKNRSLGAPAGIRDQKSRQTGNKGAREQESEGARDPGSKVAVRGSGAVALGGSAGGVQSAELDGNVVLFEQPAAKTGTQPQPPLRATAGKAVYEGEGEWLHLTMSPRVVNGGLELTAEKVDVSQQSGDAWARGDVKATWTDAGASGQNAATGGDANNGGGRGGVTLGGKGPAHVVAAEAQLNQWTGEATFRGHARLWQQTNFVSGPEIVLNQHMHTLVARSSDAAEPVRVVMLSEGGAGAGKSSIQPQGQPAGQSAGSNAGGQPAGPAVIRVHGGELRYSDADRRSVMHGGSLGAVVAETGTATSSSDAVELDLLPAGDHEASGAGGGTAQVDRMTATGHVVLTMQGRRGTGERLVYSGGSGDYVLTGTAAEPPKMSDPERGMVTGEALIFHSRDDRVSIEGGGSETETKTTAPEAHGK
jgi:lipopolysaccharide export system protein LptA